MVTITFKTEWLLLIPGILGSWRHGAYILFKLIPSLFYRSKKIDTSKKIINPEEDVTIICPCYKPDEGDFEDAIDTWIKNKPYEIIFLPDPTTIERCQEIIEKYQNIQKMKIITGYNPNKRNAMYHGYKNAKTPFVCFVDDDVLFCKTLLKELSIAFQDKNICGCAPRQVAEAKTGIFDKYDVNIHF
jgi:cellulose synthase/poly-beta-1,6-N-acetylglucosamine synthase-like glycosyltransferase